MSTASRLSCHVDRFLKQWSWWLTSIAMVVIVLTGEGPTKTYEFHVAAADPDGTDTGILARKGQVIFTSADGVVRYCITPDGKEMYCDPSGLDWVVPSTDLAYPAPGCRAMGLILEQNGRFFDIGRGRRFVAPDDGLIRLRFHDTSLQAGHDDNDRSIHVILRTA